MTCRLTLVLAGVAMVLAPAYGDPFTPGNLVVSQIGDETAAVTGAATPVYLKEFSLTASDGTFVQALALPTTVIGNNRRLMLNSDMRCGLLTRSDDGRFLVIGGYDAEAGTLKVNETLPAEVSRVIGRIDQTGSINTTTALSDCYGGGKAGSFRCAASSDGIKFWTAGCDGSGSSSLARVRYATLGAASSTVLHDGNIPGSSSFPKEPRAVNVFGGRLYWGTNETGGGLGRGVGTFGPALPDTGGQTPSIVPNLRVTLSTESGSPYDFFFPDADTVYIADDRTPGALGGLQKFVRDTDPESLTFGQLTYRYTLNAGLQPAPVQALRAVTGRLGDNGHPVLYAITAVDPPESNRLVTVTDTGCPTGTEPGCTAADTFQVLQTSPAGTIFRGVRFAPRPCEGDECLGACCRAGNACEETVFGDCDGLWQGQGTTCETQTCPFLCSNPFADADVDKDVDEADFAILQVCIGAESPLTDACKCFDRPEPGFPDGNGVIDTIDVQAFEACASGPGIPADKTCDDPPPP
jgi:hypothetical protein